MRIGFIGAGLMGHGMVGNLLKHRHQVSVIAHRNRAPIDDLVSKGAAEVGTLRELALTSEVVFLCLSSSQIVAETIAAIKPGLKRGQIIIDSGTSRPQSTRELAGELEAMGVAFADAPMTGGPEQAGKAELGVLCGADPQTFEAIKPLLACFASAVRHMGPVGSGHAAKLISNYLVTGMIALVAEAFTTAGKAHIDWRDLYDVMLNGSGNSGVLRKMVAPALDGDFDGYRFATANALKDISYFREFAGEFGQPSQLPDAVEQVFLDAVSAGLADRNVSHLLKS
jgi:3-hydroxyisobutyrate dehydrogenase-like beta-hydroxyacid dehydrogenase